MNSVITRQNQDDLTALVDLAGRLEVGTFIVSNAAAEGRALERYARLAVRLDHFRSVAGDVARRAQEQGVTLRFFGLPLCALGSARMKSNDLYWDARVTVERARGPHGTVRMSAIQARKPTRGRKYTRRCRGCAMRTVCGGVFARYLEIFGDGEVEAIH
jgi:MoaA/NifB/PqqE/SkfB family radical SAM enzyme